MDGRNIPETGYIYNFSSIYKGIVVDKNFDRSTIKDIIYKQHELLLSFDSFYNDNREQMQNLMVNDTFLECLNETIGQLSLSKVELVCINTIVYDYMSLPEKDKHILDLMLAIVYQSNQYIINGLGFWFNLQTSRLLSIILLSNSNKRTIVKRLNNFLENNKQLFTPVLQPEVIISFYDYIVGSNLVDNFSLFIGTLVDDYSGDVEDHLMYNVISDSLLRYLIKLHRIDNGIRGGDTYRLLYNYGFFIKSNNITRDRIRFTLKNRMYNDPELLVLIESIEEEYSDIVEIY